MTMVGKPDLSQTYCFPGPEIIFNYISLSDFFLVRMNYPIADFKNVKISLKKQVPNSVSMDYKEV